MLESLRRQLPSWLRTSIWGFGKMQVPRQRRVGQGKASPGRFQKRGGTKESGGAQGPLVLPHHLPPAVNLSSWGYTSLRGGQWPAARGPTEALSEAPAAHWLTSARQGENCAASLRGSLAPTAPSHCPCAVPPGAAGGASGVSGQLPKM